MTIKTYFIILLLFSFTSVLNAQSCATGKEKVQSIDKKIEKEILRLTNIERQKHGLKKLQMDNRLAYSARYHANDMAINDYFEHDSYYRDSNNSLKKVCGIFDRISAFANDDHTAENISAGRSTAKATVDSWMNSTGHRKNILNKDYTKLGVGYYSSDDSEYKTYYVQNFGGN